VREDLVDESKNGLVERIEEESKEMERDYRKDISGLLSEVGRHYDSNKKISTIAVYPRHDIHAFYTLRDNLEKTIHVQGYPGMSNENGMRVMARMMDSKKMYEAREKGISMGNEHNAVIQKFRNFDAIFYSGETIPYDPKVLERMLEENVLELRDEVELDRSNWKQYKPEGHHRYNLRDWIKSEFGFIGGIRFNSDVKKLAILRARAREILFACEQVAEIDRRANSAFVEYYKSDWPRIREAVEKKDYMVLADALNDLKGGIDCE